MKKIVSLGFHVTFLSSTHWIRHESGPNHSQSTLHTSFFRTKSSALREQFFSTFCAITGIRVQPNHFKSWYIWLLSQKMRSFSHQKFSSSSYCHVKSETGNIVFSLLLPDPKFNVCFCLSTFCTISSASISRDLNSKILKCKLCRRSEGYVAEILFLLREASISGNLWGGPQECRKKFLSNFCRQKRRAMGKIPWHTFPQILASRNSNKISAT